MGMNREVLDEWAKRSYEQARQAQVRGVFSWEIVDILKDTQKGQHRINLDEECQRYFPNSIPVLFPIYSKNGALTAGSSSKLNDGASAMILMEEEYAKERKIKPLARIKAYADTSVAPIDFTIANFRAANQLLDKTGLTLKDIDFHEIHETYASVPLANIKLLEIDPSTVNVHGGAVALGHPLGMSGNRILISLINTLKIRNSSLGMATI